MHALTDLCSEWEVETFSLGWVSRSGAANKDVNKTWTKTFPCNQSAQSVMAAVQNNMGQFADNQGSFFASTFPRGLAQLCTATKRAAPCFVMFEAWAPRTMVSGDFSYVQLGFARFVDQHRAVPAFRVVAEAAPRPLLWFEHESTLDRVAMHVTQLFHALLFGEYHEVVKAVLPDMVLGGDPRGLDLSRMGGRTHLPQEAACESLFYGLHDDRWVAALRFTQQEMNMLGHDYVAHDHKTIAPPNLLQDLEKQVAIQRAAEQWTALVATLGDEVEVSGAIVAVESVRHAGVITYEQAVSM